MAYDSAQSEVVLQATAGSEAGLQTCPPVASSVHGLPLYLVQLR